MTLLKIVIVTNWSSDEIETRDSIEAAAISILIYR